MPPIAGFKGKLYINDGSRVAVAEVREATLTIEQSEIDVTSFDSNGWMAHVAGLKSWEVEVEALWLSDDAGQGDVFDALTGGTPLAIELYPQDAASAAGYSGNAIVTSFEVGVPLDDAVTVSISMIGTGALTEITKPAV